MDWQALFNILLGLAGFILGGLSKVLWDTVTDLRTDMRTLSESVHRMPEVYVRRDDLKDQLGRIIDMLTRLDGKLDGKADKIR